MDDILKKLTKTITLNLHEQGIEMTPDEVIEHRRKAFATIRKEMKNRGYVLPDSDSELLKILSEALRG